MEQILLPEGVKIGHHNSDTTGVSVILCEQGFDTCGVDVRGSAPGTRETDLMRAEKAVERLNAVLFCGGSAYGLDASAGVMRYLREKNCGHKIGSLVVPLVSSAVIFDLDKCGYQSPDASFGYNACINAKSDGILFGSVGAGKGATVGKIMGGTGCSKGGIGMASIKTDELFVTAITVVNALGDVYDKDSGQIVSGARLENGQFLNTSKAILGNVFSQNSVGANTTLTCVITNARLNKLQANKLASIAQDGLALAIRPVHTDYDGDTAFTVSKGTINADFTQLSVMTVEAVARSIVNAVRQV